MSVRPMPGESAEMYLKSLLELGGAEDHVPISALAERLGVSPISATERVHRLEGDAQLDHLPYRGVRLTRQGRMSALRVLRRHRLWECFLHDRLGMAWDRVHEFACQLEHAVGDEVADRLAEYLHEPMTCPHGNPIPSRSGAWQRQPGVPLVDLLPGHQVVLVRIEPESTDVLSSLGQLGLRPGIRLQLEGAAADQLIIQHGDHSARVPIEAARRVVVALQA